MVVILTTYKSWDDPPSTPPTATPPPTSPEVLLLRNPNASCAVESDVGDRFFKTVAQMRRMSLVSWNEKKKDVLRSPVFMKIIS